MYKDIIDEILDGSLFLVSDISPSRWAEENIVMPKPFPGPLRYDGMTPYSREIVDFFSPTHPGREMAIMGAAQWGKTASVIVPAIGYIIANEPGNIIMTVGHDDLTEQAMDKIDYMLDGSGLRKFIRPQAQRAKAQKSGDTNKMKQFPNGYLKISSASNHKIWRQADYRYGLIDDYDAVKSSSKQAGDNRALIQKRFTSYFRSRKIAYVSSPEVESTSNIYKVYLMGDQRKFLIPCPCCGEFIELVWNTTGKNKEPAGIVWELDSENKPIAESIGYRCQKCAGFFTDENKTEFINKGHWEPTAKPFNPDYCSYHMSALYSPHGMSDWEYYVYQWLEAHPIGQKRDEGKYQAFLNLNLGLPYVETGEKIKANELQRNIRNYDAGTIPEKMSIEDGNGRIMLLTCACDLNGKLEDARLDYEIVAWSESGATYSIDHGSIGTFIPFESGKKNKVDREKWTYEHHKVNTVWKKLDELLGTTWKTDTGRNMKIYFTGIDTGYCELQAFTYIDHSNYNVVGLKGDKEHRYVKLGTEMPNFKVGMSRDKLFMLMVGGIKDDLSAYINLKWNSAQDEAQPPGFMNFPTPIGQKYQYATYFSHFEAENRILDKEGNFIWQKVGPTAQNHLFDCRVYNIALREILLHLFAKMAKVKNFTWADFCAQARGTK